MSTPSLISPAPERLRRGAGCRGFTRLELTLSLLVIGLAGALLFSGLSQWRQRARCAELGRDFQAFAAILEKARAESGRWPPAAGPMDSRLLERGWAAASPVGGEFGWVPPDGSRHPGRITLTAFHPDFPLAITRAELLELDRNIDDGDLSTGRFRTGFNGWPVYLAGGKP